MEKKLRVAQFGCGRMGSIVMKQLVEKAELVAAFDMAPALIGKDVGEHIGTGHMGLAISDGNEAEKILVELKPDAMVVTTRSLMNDLKASQSTQHPRRNQQYLLWIPSHQL